MAIILIIDGSNDISVGVRFFLLLIAFEWFIYFSLVWIDLCIKHLFFWFRMKACWKQMGDVKEVKHIKIHLSW